MHVVGHVLRAGIWVTFALLTPAAVSAVDTPVIQERNEFSKLVQSLSLDREGRLAVLLSLDDRRLRAPLLLLSVYDRVTAQP
jgi:hypothetical protein